LRVLVNHSRCYEWLAWLDWLAARDSTVVEPDTPWLSLDITSVKTYCSLLTSTFQEVLRHRSMGTSIRQVMQYGIHNAERGMAPEKGLHYSQGSVSLGNRRGQLQSQALHEGRGSIDTKPQASEHSSVSRFRRWYYVLPGGSLCDERDACCSYNVRHAV